MLSLFCSDILMLFTGVVSPTDAYSLLIHKTIADFYLLNAIPRVEFELIILLILPSEGTQSKREQNSFEMVDIHLLVNTVRDIISDTIIYRRPKCLKI